MGQYFANLRDQELPVHDLTWAELPVTFWRVSRLKLNEDSSLSPHQQEKRVSETNSTVPSAINCQVPHFIAVMTGGRDFDLKEFSGKKVVLYFYPKDNTRVVTAESMAFRDLYEHFQAKNTVIFGISRDSLRSMRVLRRSLACHSS